MAATRQPQPVQIHQDSNATPQPAPTTNKPRPQLQPSAMPRQPMPNPSPYAELQFNPPMNGPHPMSPLKSQPLPHPDQQYNPFNYVPIPAPTHIHGYTDSPQKKNAMGPPMPQLPPYHQPRMAPQPMFTTFNSNFETFEQENFPLPSSAPEQFVQVVEPPFARRPHLKRSYSESAPISNQFMKRLKSEDDLPTHLPEPEEMPRVEDDGGKPSYSYAQMIGMAILRAPHRRLTLAQIYEWISSNFAFYRQEGNQGWHNSIRHNLSLNKAFKKQERPKGDAGKGSYWVIEPGMELQFVRDKSRKNHSLGHITMQQGMGRQTLQQLAPPLAEALAPKQWIIQSTPEPAPRRVPASRPVARPQTAPALPDLSSDATLPASDPALDQGETADSAVPVLPPPSSPPPVINSSPPVAAGNGRHRRVSSPAPTSRPSSRKHQKNHSAAADDSGYWSSLDSSVRRPNNNKSGIVLTSEIDPERPQKIRGRAEEEIARIRSSSHDTTPSTRRFVNVCPDAGRLSSPTHPSPSHRANPATPAVVFKKPMPPPQSISPNSQLRRHREAMQQFLESPVKAPGFWGTEYETYSPAFKVHTPLGPSAFDEHFQIYADHGAGFTPTVPLFDSSPIKRSVKRVSGARPQHTPAVLSDAGTRANRVNTKTPSKPPVLKPSAKPVYAGSPLRTSVAMGGGMNENEDFLDFGSFVDENSDNEGLDILQGFQKIGGSNGYHRANGSGHGQGQSGSRPALGMRSFTSRF